MDVYVLRLMDELELWFIWLVSKNLVQRKLAERALQDSTSWIDFHQQ